MNKKKTIASNYIWRLAEKSGAEGVTFVVSLILARILDPEVYGTIALVTVFTSILSVFVDSGLGNSLIQKKEADNIDFSTVFYFNVLCCFFIYFLIYLVAPFIALFYNDPSLTLITRVLSLTIVISGIKNIQQAYVSKHLLFRKFFFSTLGGTITAAIVGIFMALNGYGVWALVAQLLVNNTIDTFILWITVPWRPQKSFSFTRLSKLLRYGWKLSASHLLDNIYKNLRTIFIGKIYTKSDLAYYNKGNQFPRLLITNTVSSLDSILFPVMSDSQENAKRLKEVTRTVNKVTTYVVCPCMIGMAICAKSIIKVLLSDKWLPCAPYMQILCISYILWPLHTANLNVIKSIGRSDIFIRIELVKKVIGLTIIIVSVKYGVLAIAFGELIIAPINALINAYPLGKLIAYKLHEQLLDIFPNIAISIIMGAIVYLISIINLPILMILILQVIAGITSYILLSYVTKNEGMKQLLTIIKH